MIRLFYNYYEDPNIARKREIDLCLQKNLQNKFLNVVLIEQQSKLSYNDFFTRINKVITNEDDISIICNSDIFFDETIELANKIEPKQLYALSRWDWHQNQPPILFNRPDSQDTWIVRGTISNVDGNFTLGKKGCDNRIAHEFHKAGYSVINPSKSIKTYHVHGSNIRNYSYSDVVPGPYLTCGPIELT